LQGVDVARLQNGAKGLPGAGAPSCCTRRNTLLSSVGFPMRSTPPL
jgi:hypothetical protein